MSLLYQEANTVLMFLVILLHEINLLSSLVVTVRQKDEKMYCRLAVLMAEKDPQLSQRKLSRETGLSTTTINKLFTNNFDRVDRETAETLCQYFGCGVGDLFELREDAV